MIEQYDHKTLVGMFDGQDVSPILPYDSIDADVATIDASTQASGRISISGVQPKYAMVVDNGVLRFAREGEQGRYILKIAPIEPHIIERPWVPVNEWMTMRMAELVYGIFRIEKPQAKELIYSCGLPENLARNYYWGYDYRRQTLSFK